MPGAAWAPEAVYNRKTTILYTGPAVWEQTDMQETDYIVTRQRFQDLRTDQDV